MITNAEENIFKKDFLILLKNYRNIITNYREDYLAKSNIDTLKQYADLFSKKYKTLQVKIKEKGLEPPQIKLHFQDKDIYQIFKNIENELVSITSIKCLFGDKYTNFSRQEFIAEFDRLKDHFGSGFIYYNYVHNNKSDYFKVKIIKPDNNFELIYDPTLFDTNSPAYKLCRFYAFLDGYNLDEDLSKNSVYMGRVQKDGEHLKSSVSNP